MDKKIILAVAGAGKTTLLLNKLNEKDRFYLEHLFDNYEEAKEYYNSVIQDNLDRLQSWYEAKKKNISKRIENLPDEKP